MPLFGKKRRAAEKRIAGMEQDIRQSIADTPSYEMPAEVQQLLDMYQAQAGKIEGLAGLGQEATDIAKMEAGAAEMPGMGQAREMIEAGTAGTVQDIVQAGGGSAASLSAIAQAGQNELNAMRDLSIQNQQFRQQASDEYRQSLMGQAGLESSLLGQSAGMQAAGLGTAIGQRGMEYQSELDKARNLQQFDIGQLGNVMAQEEARKARNAQMVGQTIGGLFSLGGSLITGGLLGGGGGQPEQNPTAGISMGGATGTGGSSPGGLALSDMSQLGMTMGTAGY